MQEYISGGGENSHFLTLEDVCTSLSISHATGRNWVRLGKITPYKKDGEKLFFLREDVDRILDTVASGEFKALNRRRNKSKISGLSLYESYVSCAYNIDLVNNIISEYEKVISPALLSAILSNFALQFICQKKDIKIPNNAITEYVHGNLDIGFYSVLIDDLIDDISEIDLDSDIFNKGIKYVSSEDTLGFVYISLMNIGKRKARGAYYTPLEIVNSLVSHLTETIEVSGKSVFDPCCGSGNFLLAIGEKTESPEMIYGQDIDPVAVKLLRISFALKYDVTDIEFLYSHFTCADTLIAVSDASYDIIIGNPPWGGDIAKDYLKNLAANYRTVVRNGTETFNLFIEWALSVLSDKGVLAFVLPEAVFSVAAHRTIRSIIIDECNFKFVCYLGNVFSGVHCPAVILGVQKAKDKCVGTGRVFLKEECYRISSNRQVTPERFNFHVKDELQDCLDLLIRTPNHRTLAGSAKFALGIVTGDNATYISNVCHDGYEPVLKGNDLKKYSFKNSGSYIRYTPEHFQQVAPTELYRAPEKLLYRFICETLVFAYDNRQTLSLNSCNILIPQIIDMDIKYVLAVLNSRAAGFYFINMFNSVKVLRSQIEQIPVPSASEKEQIEAVTMVDSLIDGNNNKLKIYNELDNFIMSLYGISDTAKQIITSSLSERSLILL